jgi:uncharacterized Ntn-hydrolase superfamily protein
MPSRREGGSVRPVATYSIVAVSEDEIGVAVQSHWYNVGAVVPWVEASVGAVAVQSFSGPEHGLTAIEALRSGASPQDVLAGILTDEVQERGGQIAIVAADGATATHTGAACIPEAGHGVGAGYSAQANLMDTDEVWGAMSSAFEDAKGDLAQRMLISLVAAERVGGDVRGRQSAALVVATTGRPAPLDRVFDLRVEDAPDPLAELRRLVRIRRAYIKLNEGDQLVARHDLTQALEAYRDATTLAGDDVADGEAAFWTAVALAAQGRIEDALPYMRRAGARSDRWARLIPRLVAPAILPDDPATIDLLVRAVRGESS